MEENRLKKCKKLKGVKIMVTLPGEEDGLGGSECTDGRAAGRTRNLEEWEIWP